MILPFLEFKEDEIDSDCCKCEYVISSDESLHDSYRIGLEKVKEFIKSKEDKLMNNILTKEDKNQFKQNSIEKYNFLCQKLKSEENLSNENTSDFDESEMSEILLKMKLIVLLL